jgi:hypothetical protein
MYYNLLKYALIDIGIVGVTFGLFSLIIPREKRHRIWEKHISGFSKFVVFMFIISITINAATAYITYRLLYERYLNIIAPAVQSVIIGFVAACVPRRGVGDEPSKEDPAR